MNSIFTNSNGASNQPDGPWALKLFVAGESRISALAIQNLKKLVEVHLPSNTRVRIVDLVREPDAEGNEEVLAVPLLVRDQPKPPRRVIGDLADTEKVLRGIGLVTS